jgi:bla regulator protein blaR1
VSTLNHLVQTPFAKSLGWTIFHTLWEGAVVAGILFVALLAIRSARARYAAACATLQ